VNAAAVGLPPFQRFLDAHRAEVWRFLVASVGPSEADDCFQETFLAALRAYPRLRPDSNLRAWVMTIAHRKALDAHRARRRRPLPSESVAAASDAGGAVAPSDPGPPRAAPPAEPADGELWSAVRELPPRQRAAVLLRYVGDLSHAEAAAAIGCSEEAARRSLHEALKRLREVWRP
jgi:RNA polymerase sigma factor (sigma-70 family)